MFTLPITAVIHQKNIKAIIEEHTIKAVIKDAAFVQYGDTAIVSEELIGVVDGVNKIFFSSQAFKPSTTSVFVNGVRQRRNISYTETANIGQITFDEAPSNNIFTDYLFIIYTKA